MGLGSLFMNAQVVNQSNASATSVGLGAGVSTVSSGSSYFGYQAGNVSSTTTVNLRNSFFGDQAGKNITTGNNNTYLGFSAGTGGAVGTTATYNTFIGTYSGATNNGTMNVGVGMNANSGSTTNHSTSVGAGAGQGLTGNNNTMVGYNAGQFINGSDNVLVGYKAGYSNYGSGPFTGTGNVLIGNNVGGNMGLSNKLMIDNSSTTTPLIWGDFTNDQVKLNGKVGIGFGTLTNFPTTAGSVNVSGYNLFVGGGILTEEIRVNLRNGSSLWADYVFHKDYALKSLPEVEKFIADNGHLPNVPSAKEVKENGIELGEMAKIQQEKIEELTLYLIEQNKAIEELKAQLSALISKK